MVAKRFKECCRCNEINGREDEKEVGNLGSECETDKMEIVETLKLIELVGMVNRVRLLKLNKG
jgi:hypothetical protein